MVKTAARKNCSRTLAYLQHGVVKLLFPPTLKTDIVYTCVDGHVFILVC